MGRKKPSSQPTRRKPVGKSSLAVRKRGILGSSDWIVRGLDFCEEHGRWPEWEKRLLDALSRHLTFDFDSALVYSFRVMKQPWPNLEDLLVRRMHKSDLTRMSMADWYYFIQYSRCHNGSQSLEHHILAQGCPSAAFAYAAYGTRRPWQLAESLILSAETAISPALCTGMGDILDINQWVRPWASQAVTYARLFLPNGWPELEDKMARGKCHPQVAYEYAERILQGPLPPPIAAWLTMSVFDDKGKEYQRKYYEFVTRMKAKLSHSINSAPSPLP